MIKSIELVLKNYVFNYFLRFDDNPNRAVIVDTSKVNKNYFINSNKFFFDLIQKNIFRPFILASEEFEYRISWSAENGKTYYYSIKINNGFVENEELKLVEGEESDEYKENWGYGQDYKFTFSEIHKLINISKDEIQFGDKWYSEELNYDEVIEKLYLDIPNKRECLLLPKLDCLNNIFKYLLEDVEIYFPGERLTSYLELKKDESTAMKRMLETFDLGFTKITEDWKFLFNEYEIPLEDLGSGANYLMERLPQIIKAVFRNKTYFETGILNNGNLHTLLREHIPRIIKALIKHVKDQSETNPGQVIFI